MISNFLLATGLVLTTASQLRLPGIPLGPGEACLLAWLIVASFRFVMLDHAINRKAFFKIVMFWLCFALALSLGMCVGYLRRELNPDWVSHDAFAYLLMAGMSCLIVATMTADDDLRRTMWLIVLLWNSALLLQITFGSGILTLAAIEPWYWDRFRGWSENPNQLALFCAVMASLSLHLALTHIGAARIFALLSLALSLMAGRMTRSDTFLIAMLTSSMLFCVLLAAKFLAFKYHRSGFRFAVAALVIAAIIPLSISITPYALAVSDEAEALAASLAKDGGGDGTVETAALRLQLWEDAMATGLSSGSLGLGPGPHLRKPSETSQFSPTPFEAHNTLLDIFLQGGLLGVLALSGLVASILISLLRARLDALTIGLAALAIFSISHFIIRHPILWFALSLSLVLGSTPRPASPVFSKFSRYRR